MFSDLGNNGCMIAHGHTGALDLYYVCPIKGWVDSNATGAMVILSSAAFRQHHGSSPLSNFVHTFLIAPDGLYRLESVWY